MRKNVKRKSEFTHGGSTLKCLGLLLKAIIAACGYGLIWVGAISSSEPYGMVMIVAGAVITFLSALLYIIIPISKMIERR